MARFGNGYLDGQYKNGSDGKLFKFEGIYFSTYTTDGDPESLKEQPNHVLAQSPSYLETGHKSQY